MIFFSGFGFLAPLAVIGSFVITVMGESWIKSHFNHRVPNFFFGTMMAILPFVAMLGVDWMLKKLGPTRRAVDVRTGATVEVAQSHTFMFLPMKWCAYIWLGLAVACWIATMVH
jgi:hypothetical protein